MWPFGAAAAAQEGLPVEGFFFHQLHSSSVLKTAAAADAAARDTRGGVFIVPKPDHPKGIS